MNKIIFLSLIMASAAFVISCSSGSSSGGVDLTVNGSGSVVTTDPAIPTGGDTGTTTGSSTPVSVTTETAGTAEESSDVQASVSAVLKDGKNEPASGISIVVKDSAGNVIMTLSTDSSGTAFYNGSVPRPVGALSIEISGANFQTQTVSAASIDAIGSALESAVLVAKNVVSGTSDTSSFDFSTVQQVSFGLTIRDAAGNAIPGAILTVLGSSGAVITTMIADANGVITSSASFSKAEGTVSIKISASGYIDAMPVNQRTISDLSSIDGTVYLVKAAAVVVIIDKDGDGVAAENDADDNNANVAAVNKETFVFAFEDNYAKGTNTGGDRDFNDVVVKLVFKEYVNSSGKVTKITVDTKVMAALSSANNKVMVKTPFLSAPVTLVENAKTYTYKGETILFESAAGIEKTAAGTMPYDPYMIPGGNINNGEVHLAAFNTTAWPTIYTYRTTSDPCPWALVLPENWAWPKEGVSILKAYPRFKSWYTSGGKDNQDWYLYPDLNFCTTSVSI